MRSALPRNTIKMIQQQNKTKSCTEFSGQQESLLLQPIIEHVHVLKITSLAACCSHDK